jgi:hypothetical protein
MVAFRDLSHFLIGWTMHKQGFGSVDAHLLASEAEAQRCLRSTMVPVILLKSDVLWASGEKARRTVALLSSLRSPFILMNSESDRPVRIGDTGVRRLLDNPLLVRWCGALPDARVPHATTSRARLRRAGTCRIARSTTPRRRRCPSALARATASWRTWQPQWRRRRQRWSQRDSRRVGWCWCSFDRAPTLPSASSHIPSFAAAPLGVSMPRARSSTSRVLATIDCSARVPTHRLTPPWANTPVLLSYSCV